MNVDMDTDDWLGCPTSLEMYQHQCSILVDELAETERMLSRARANIAGLVQMNDALLIDKVRAEVALKGALERISGMSQEPAETGSFRSIDLITGQRDHLFRENQRLLAELRALKESQP